MGAALDPSMIAHLWPTLNLANVKDTTAAGASIATIVVAGAAAYWFLRRAAYRVRVDFDVRCTFFPPMGKERLVEVLFTLNNAGEIEHHCGQLAYEVQSIDPSSKKVKGNPGKPPSFLRRSGNIVPVDIVGYYYARAGVSLRVSARFWLPLDVAVIRVMAFALYDSHPVEVDETAELFSQLKPIKDWIALDRSFVVTEGPTTAVASAAL